MLMSDQGSVQTKYFKKLKKGHTVKIRMTKSVEIILKPQTNK